MEAASKGGRADTEVAIFEDRHQDRFWVSKHSPGTNQQIEDQAEKDRPVYLRMQITFETLLSCIIFKY